MFTKSSWGSTVGQKKRWKKLINKVRREKNRREAVWNGRVTTHRVGERKKGWSMPRTIRNLYEFSMSNTNNLSNSANVLWTRQCSPYNSWLCYRTRGITHFTPFDAVLPTGENGRLAN